MSVQNKYFIVSDTKTPMTESERIEFVLIMAKLGEYVLHAKESEFERNKVIKNLNTAAELVKQNRLRCNFKNLRELNENKTFASIKDSTEIFKPFLNHPKFEA